MVGIHARTGREKIFAQNVARILSMQLQQYLQCAKILFYYALFKGHFWKSQKTPTGVQENVFP